MSSYAHVISELTRLHPNAQIGLGELLNVRAWAALKPDDLYVTGIRGDSRIRTIKGDDNFGIPPRGDFNILDLSGDGFGMQWPAAANVRGTDYMQTYASLPDYLRKPFTYRDLGRLYGQNYVDFMKALYQLYIKRVFGHGILSKEEEWGVRQLLNAGMPVWLEPKMNSKRWTAAAKQFDPIVRAYVRGEMEEAAQAAKWSELNAKAWNIVYNTTEFVAQLPSKLAEAALDAIGAGANTFIKHNTKGIVIAASLFGAYLLLKKGAKKGVRAALA